MVKILTHQKPRHPVQLTVLRFGDDVSLHGGKVTSEGFKLVKYKRDELLYVLSMRKVMSVKDWSQPCEREEFPSKSKVTVANLVRSLTRRKTPAVFHPSLECSC